MGYQRCRHEALTRHSGLPPQPCPEWQQNGGCPALLRINQTALPFQLLTSCTSSKQLLEAKDKSTNALFHIPYQQLEKPFAAACLAVACRNEPVPFQTSELCRCPQHVACQEE